MWSILFIVILSLVFFILVGVSIYFWFKNSLKTTAIRVYPFSASLPNPSQGSISEGISLLNSVGQPQIQCPIGYKVNILGAWLQVNDPFGECSPTPNSTFLDTCGIANSGNRISCTSDATCATGMNCVSGKCVPIACKDSFDLSESSSANCTSGGGTQCSPKLFSKCSKNSDCDSSTLCYRVGNKSMCLQDPSQGSCQACNNGNCAQFPLCQFLNSSGQNMMCETSNTTSNCKPRDASAYLASWCDGKNSCLGSGDTWLPNQPGGQFGPLPCNIPASEQSADYQQLPIVSGWNGGSPAYAQNDTDVSPNYNQGYYIHGIYTCVPSIL